MDRHDNIRLEPLDTMKQSDINSYIEHVNSCLWRQKYHVQSVIGTAAAPAAVFFDANLSVYHMLYMWQPVPEEPDYYWYHVTSPDLAVFNNEGVKLRPDTIFDDRGLSAGSALNIKGETHIFYIGRSVAQDRTRFKLLMTWMDERFKFKKHSIPLIEGQEEYYRQVKDSKIIRHGNKYVSLSGAESMEGFGRIAVHEADDLSDFKYKGDLLTDLDEFGWLWEHPDHFTMDNRDILVFCTQGVDRFGNHFRNNFQAGYLMGELDFNHFSMAHGDYKEFDAGFDFYAPKIFKDSEQRNVMIGTLGMPTTSYPTGKFHMNHCFSIPRVLKLKEDRLIQQPHPNLVNLREDEVTALGYFKQYNKRMRDFYGEAYELIVDFNDYDASVIYLHLRVGKRDETTLSYDAGSRIFKLDTLFSGEQPEGADSNERYVHLEQPLYKLHIFMDVSSLEVFINDGEAVMSSRIFPSEDATGFELSTETGQCYVNLTRYELKRLDHEEIIYQK